MTLFDRIFRRRSVEFEFGTAGFALAAMFVGPMWMDYLHNNWPGSTVLAQGLVAAICTIVVTAILVRLLWIYRV